MRFREVYWDTTSDINTLAGGGPYSRCGSTPSASVTWIGLRSCSTVTPVKVRVASAVKHHAAGDATMSRP